MVSFSGEVLVVCWGFFVVTSKNPRSVDLTPFLQEAARPCEQKNGRTCLMSKVDGDILAMKTCACQ